MSRFAIALVAANIIFLTAAYAGQDAANEEWNPPSAGPITAWTAPLCGKGKLVVQPFFFYNKTRGSFDAGGDYGSLPEGDKKYQYQEQLFVQYGLTERLEIDGQSVYQQNFIEQEGLKAHAEGFGDSYLFLRYCALEEQTILPHITGVFQLKIPSGKYQKADPDKLGTDLMGAASGGGSYDHGYGIQLTKRLKPFIIHADALYSFPVKRKVDGVKTRYGAYLNYDFGIEYFLLPKGFNLMLELNGFLQGDKEEDGRRSPGSDVAYLTAAPGIGWSNKYVQAILAYQRTLAGTNTDANDSVVMTFVYTF